MQKPSEMDSFCESLFFGDVCNCEKTMVSKKNDTPVEGAVEAVEVEAVATPTGILAKLLEFQKLNISLVKDGSNPHFKSKYATLNEVLEKVKKPLSDLGVLILQVPTMEGLKTQLFDVTDKSFVDAFMPYVDATSPQKLGSNNTYNRRYSLITLLGLQDDDDDANVASVPTRKPVAVAQPVPVATKAVASTGTPTPAPVVEEDGGIDDLIN